MTALRKKAVVSADADDLLRVEQLVHAGAYRNVSQFVREAMAEKLAREQRARLAEQVARYSEAGHATEDIDLVARQAVAKERRRAKG
jgi:Arc/MetJ-type ribon-helix-helix transcriptional regulator